MRIMLLVPTIPKTLNDNVPWHFFQDLKPMTERGSQFCVLSGVSPEYTIEGVEFIQIYRKSIKRNMSEFLRCMQFAWAIRNFLPTWNPRYLRGIIKLCQWNLSVYEYAAAWKPNVIHSHWAFPDGSAGMLAAKMMNIPYIMTLRGIEHKVVPQFYYGNCLDSFYEKTLTTALRFANQITLCCSDSVERLKALNAYTPERITKVYNGIDFKRFGFDHDKIRHIENRFGLSKKKLITCVARMEDNGLKGHHVLIEAFAKLYRDNLDVMLILVGDGPDKERLKKQVKLLGVESQVIFYGSAHPCDIPSILRMSTVSVLPSYSETFSNIVFESLACETPVISSAVGTPKHILPAGPYGYTFEPGNVKQLCDCISNVINHLQAAKLMAIQGRDFVEREFTLHNRVSSFYKIYNELT